MRGTLVVTSQKSSNGKIWLYGLLLLIAVFLGAMVFSFVKAAREGSPVVDRDYYRHGQVYAPADAGGAAARLGWRAEPTYRNGRLELRITDRNGAPVTGGTLTVTLEGKGAPAGTLTCGIEAPGVYCVPLIPASGTVFKAGWIFRRGSDTMSGRMTVMP
jgi:nitrogen fixation protein FixH